MFTGIVEELGEVLSLMDGRLTVRCRLVTRDSDVGASVAVHGACLTVVDRADDRLAFDVTPETLSRTSLGRLAPGDGVHLERPVTLAARMGGHLVQGHVDGVGTVVSLHPDGQGGASLRLRLPEDLARYAVEKGSITVDGISLTVAAVDDDSVSIAVIPHTIAVTAMGSLEAGDPVNLEMDVIAKYVERLLTKGRNGS